MSVNKRRDELLEQARERRESAARLRRLARGLSLNDDHERMMRQADALEAEAHRLERQAYDAGDDGDGAAPTFPLHGQPVRQEQVQQQQQHESPEKSEAEPDSNKPPSKS